MDGGFRPGELYDPLAAATLSGGRRLERAAMGFGDIAPGEELGENLCV